MSSVPFKVYILRKHFDHSSLNAVNGCCDDSVDWEVLQMFSLFSNWLRDETRHVGFTIQGPNQTTDTGWTSEFIVCLHSPWPALYSIPDCECRNPTGEIFESSDDTFYVDHETLIPLQGEVLADFYSDDHGLQIDCFETDLRRKLERACMAECHSLGYNRAAASDIASGMAEELFAISPNTWTWDRVQEAIAHHVESFASARRRPYTWMVREQLLVESTEDLAEPIADGDLIREVIPAMHQEGNAMEWLVNAQALLQFLRLPTPEFDTVRHLQTGELFFSERGLMFSSADGPVWLGEIATDLLHDRHGQCMADAERLVREEVIRLLLGEVQNDHPLTTDQYAEAVDTAHDLAARTEVLQMWYQDVAELVDQLFKHVKLSDF